MDPFAELVNLLKPEAVLWKTIEAHGSWALRFNKNKDVNFGIVLSGSCLLIEKGGASRRIDAGDFLMQSKPETYEIASDLGLPAKDGELLLARAKDRVLRLGPDSSQATKILAGHFFFDSVNHDLLLDFLPRLAHIRADSLPAKKISSLLAFTAEEAIVERPGSSIIVQRAMEIILVEVLRDHSLFSPDGRYGLIAGLADPMIKVVLKELHGTPGAQWTVAKMSLVVGVSRTLFAEQFRRVTGITPMEYLLNWRMALAKDKLRHSRQSLQEIATAIGYKSASAFSTAFSHRFGCAPREFRAGALIVKS